MTKDRKLRFIRNADNANLMPTAYEGGMVLDYDYEVNGEGAKEIPGFIPTREELSQLVKYWASVHLDKDWSFFCTGSTGSSEILLDAFAGQRISRITSLLGDEDVDTAIAEVYAQFRERQGQKVWQIFRQGNQAQRDRVLDDFDMALRGEPKPVGGYASQPNMLLTSPSFKEGGPLGDRFSAEGENMSPPLAWSQPPAETRSLVIIMCDLEGRDEIYRHWLIYGIPPNCLALEESIPPQEQLASGARQGKNSYNKIGYHGPHRTVPFNRYQFRVYALDQLLALEAGISNKELLDAMEGHILDEGHLTVVYGT